MTYNKTGNLIGDASESISRINWTVYGKIASITKSGNTMSYGYDATGNRITKKVSTTKEDYYVRDAQGNVLALYAYDNSSFTWAEQHLYGSSRLGMVSPGLTIQSTTPLANASYNAASDPITNGTEGKRIYELANHLGNVMVTISDKKIGVDENSDAVIDYYTAEVLTAQDYYAFGMLMPGRTYSNAGAKYKYGFNGKENDNEVKGEGNQQDYGMRIYDPRLGRFLSVDPLTKKYPELTPYQYASNNPIQNTDLDGLEGVARNLRTGEVAKGPLDPNRFPASNGWITNMPKLSNPVFTATFKMVAKEREIMMNNGLGTNYIGPESIVLDNIAIDRRNYSNAVLDNIRGGLGGTVGYWVGGERGSFYGAVVDGIAFSFTGIPGNSRVLSRPQNVQTNQYTPSTESPLVNQSGGAYRASKFANNWRGGSLSETMKNFGVNPIGVRTESGKTIYSNAETGIQVIYDQGGNYFRINNTNILGKRSFLSLDGSNPTNKVENGRTSGRTQDEYNRKQPTNPACPANDERIDLHEK